MTLFEGCENQTYKITNIQTQDEALKHRFLSLGITKNSQIFLERFSSNKATLAIQVNHTKIALRDSEAQNIFVEAI
ncbi:FeoA family protein [Helicobacter kayseriensis]|uniref:FeoA family protein n=1 Tax=Helicobacter kayseriensis TaxID=2905877 RepID=UPI001E614B2C|nr:FeoA family protein [Helicobacter kayseriensis]MCE3047429.1 ferrous iron transport protein A [Helicobacter kayseriensis]MCE3048900.1 ferrous iron transport protein A [Helicobacter kayseriensis]